MGKKKMKDAYVIYLNSSGEFLEHFKPDSFGGEVFGTTDLGSARQFATADEAQDFADENLVDAVVLKWI